MKKIGIIGTGVFGTALALTATRAENQVLCWARNPEVINSINKQHQNPKYLPQISLPASIAATSELAEVFLFSNTILLTVSAQATRSIMRQIKPFLRQDTILLLCAKGIEETTGQILSEIAATENPTTNIAILSGPGFAIDIAQKRFASVTIACKNKDIAQQLTTTLGTPFFRPYMTTDIISPQIGGSVKNVIAIASGIAEGAAFGDGSRAALITRGFTEMARLSKALGGELQTMMGMCGMGDLVMTASCTQSRNFSFGKKIGLYGSAAQALAENTQTVEGIFTARAVVKRAQDLGIEMPICETINRILYHGISLKEAIDELLSRSYKSEGI